MGIFDFFYKKIKNNRSTGISDVLGGAINFDWHYKSLGINRSTCFSGGAGDSIKNAIKINVSDPGTGGGAKCLYLTEKYGLEGTDWTLSSSSFREHKGKLYDSVLIKLSSGTDVTIYFDITAYSK